jgi:hypothetical protein
LHEWSLHENRRPLARAPRDDENPVRHDTVPRGEDPLMTDGVKRRDDEATPVLDPTVKAELKRLAILFLMSAFTLVLVVADAVARAILHDVLPGIVFGMVQLSWLGGAFATYFYGLYVTIRARAWGWVVLCAVPLVGSVPGSVAYSWIRRGALERQILGEEANRRP